jgi:hypothetical protein
MTGVWAASSSSRTPRILSGRNMKPNWQTTRSNDPSSKTSACASATCQTMPRAGTAFRAYATIGSFRSVATRVAESASASRKRLVTIPVPQATSKGFREARRVLTFGGLLLANIWQSMEANPVAGVIHTTVARLFPAVPPRFMETPYGYHDTDRIRADLAQAGWEDVRLDSVRVSGSWRETAQACACSSGDQRRLLDGALHVQHLARCVVDHDADYPRREVNVPGSVGDELRDP